MSDCKASTVCELLATVAFGVTIIHETELIDKTAKGNKSPTISLPKQTSHTYRI